MKIFGRTITKIANNNTTTLTDSRNKQLTNTSTSSSTVSILLRFEQSIQEDNISNTDHLAYLETLKENEQKMLAYLISRDQLKTSFDIDRSNGFQEFLARKKT